MLLLPQFLSDFNFVLFVLKELVPVHRTASQISEISIRNQLALIKDELQCHWHSGFVSLSFTKKKDYIDRYPLSVCPCVWSEFLQFFVSAIRSPIVTWSKIIKCVKLTTPPPPSQVTFEDEACSKLITMSCKHDILLNILPIFYHACNQECILGAIHVRSSGMRVVS